jgi:hypothetical protein
MIPYIYIHIYICVCVCFLKTFAPVFGAGSAQVMEYMPHLAFDADAVIHICNAEAVCHEAEPPLAPEDGCDAVAGPKRWGFSGEKM